MLVVKDLLLVRGKKTILQIDEFRLNQSDKVALIGSNGAGKSTFLKTLALLEKPTAGSIFFVTNWLMGEIFYLLDAV